MAKMASEAFVDKAIDIAKNYQTLYVMGCFGAPLTGANVDRYCQNHAFNRQAPRPARIKSVANRRPPVYGFDCSCLIKAILWGWNGNSSKSYGGAVYGSNGVPDVSANGMIAQCSSVSTSGWGSMVPGEALWMNDHIGIYIGDGLAVECTPIWKDGVQVTAVGNIGQKAGYNTRTWKKHGKLPWVDYANASTGPDYRAQVQKRFGFDNNTMAFLDKHPHVGALYMKLATKD